MISGRLVNKNTKNVLGSRNSQDSKSIENSEGGKGALRKSLIPLPVSSPTNDENSPHVKQILKLQKNSDSSRPEKKKLSGAATPKRSEKTTLKGKSVTRVSLKDGSSGTPVNKLRLSCGVPKTPQNSPSKTKLKKSNEDTVKETQTNAVAIEAEEIENESIEYWKELAESRRQALEEALKENYDLHARVEELQKQISELEVVAKEAEKLATMLTEAVQDFDESGICENDPNDNEQDNDDENDS